MEKGTRIQKVLSDQGIASRRKAEELIRSGKVKVNGHLAIIGQKINPMKDLVTIDDKKIAFQKNTRKVYIMLNKPRGFVTTLSDELGRKCVAELVGDLPERVYPIGRLDKDSEGLLLLTNDGEFANVIMHPSHHISKTYRVTVRPTITDAQTVQLSTGVVIDDKKTSPAHVTILEKVPGRVVLQIVIYEGRNRQVRKMCEAVGLEVARLKRTSVGPIKLGMLAPGKWRELKPGEVGMLRNAVKASSGEPELLNDMDKNDSFAQKNINSKSLVSKQKSYADKKSVNSKKSSSFDKKDKPSYAHKKDKSASEKSYGDKKKFDSKKSAPFDKKEKPSYIPKKDKPFSEKSYAAKKNFDSKKYSSNTKKFTKKG